MSNKITLLAMFVWLCEAVKIWQSLPNTSISSSVDLREKGTNFWRDAVCSCSSQNFSKSSLLFPVSNLIPAFSTFRTS